MKDQTGTETSYAARVGNDVSALVHVLSQFHPVNKKIESFFRQHIIPLHVSRKKLILREGALCNHVYFIKRGVLRGFIKEDNREITTWITAEGEMVTSIASMDERKPSREYIQAIEDCELMALNYEHLDKLYKDHIEFNIIGRKLLQRYYHDAEKRAFIARLTNAEDKYRQFLLQHETLSNRIPLTHIANYLGITLETLSRVRRKLNQPGKEFR